MQFEKRQNVSDKPLSTCEKCHGKLEKQWSLSGFQFKGAGWYVTDYSTKGKGTEKTSGPESTASTDSASKPADTTTPAKDSTTAKKD